MTKANFLKTSALAGLTFSLAFLSACTKEEDRITSADLMDASTESLTDSYFEDMDDMSLVAAQDENAAGGRIATDDRFSQAELTFDGNVEEGTIVIDFGTGSTDLRGNVRTGILNIEYSNGPIGETGFTVVITPENYTINTVKLEGVRTIERLASTSQYEVIHEISTTNGKATWPDQAVSTRNSTFVRTVTLNPNYVITEVSIEGEASGTNRRGRAYTMEILDPLVFKRECVLNEGIYMAVDGRKKFTSDNRELVIDYGDGACDRQVTIQIGDFTRTFGVDGQ